MQQNYIRKDLTWSQGLCTIIQLQSSFHVVSPKIMKYKTIRILRTNHDSRYISPISEWKEIVLNFVHCFEYKISNRCNFFQMWWMVSVTKNFEKYFFNLIALRIQRNYVKICSCLSRLPRFNSISTVAPQISVISE